MGWNTNKRKEETMRKRRQRVEHMAIVHPNAAGLDSGASEIYGCVPPDRAEENVKVFGPFTPDLHRLADWLTAHEVATVALESTGV
jgi:transposase